MPRKKWKTITVAPNAYERIMSGLDDLSISELLELRLKEREALRTIASQIEKYPLIVKKYTLWGMPEKVKQ